MSFFGQGTSLPCSYLAPSPDPQVGGIIFTDCVLTDFLIPTEQQGRLWVNCAGPPVPVEESSWGAIKQLFGGDGS